MRQHIGSKGCMKRAKIRTAVKAQPSILAFARPKPPPPPPPETEIELVAAPAPILIDDQALNPAPTLSKDASDNPETEVQPPAGHLEASKAKELSAHQDTRPPASSKSVLTSFNESVHRLPDSIPLGTLNDGLFAPFGMSRGEFIQGLAADEVWETLDKRMNRIVGRDIPMDTLRQSLRRGPYGLHGLSKLVTSLIEAGDVEEGLLEGKLGRLTEAILGL